MATNNTKSLYANTIPTKIALNSLTRDVTVQACIFELIDNSIDAKKDGKCEIKIQIIDSIFSIQDNGCGISVDDFKNSALRFGRVDAEKQSSIGAFGVGLNRAILKLAKELDLSSETKDERTSVVLNLDDYLKDEEEWNIPISRIEKIGNTGTLIKITLKEEIKSIFDEGMIKELQNELSKRYGYLILKKRCAIYLNNNEIDAKIPRFRNDGDFKILTKSFCEKEVEVEIQLGQQERHKFSYEGGSNPSINKQIKPDQGWFVYCNDRAILLNNISADVGWDSISHSQHDGFVGMIHFRGKPALLPWGTDKVNINLNNEIYKKALPFMRDFSMKWRSHTDKAKKTPKGEQMSFPTTANVPISSTISDSLVSSLVDFNADTKQWMPSQIPASIDDDKTTLIQENHSHNVADHPNNTKYLFGDSQTNRITFNSKANKKIQAVVKELQQLEIAKYTCSVQFLFRVLIEESCKHYAENKGLNKDKPLRQMVETITKHYFDEQNNNNSNKESSKDRGHIKTGILAACHERNAGGSASIEFLQTSLHSSHDFLSPTDICALWRKLEPFIKICLK